MINRNVTRTILNGVETTAKTKSLSNVPLTCALTTTTYLYLGFKQPFTTRYINLSVVNTNACTLAVSYWDGSAWTAVEDLVDETNGFTQSGFISWLNFGQWDRKSQTPIIAVGSENEAQLDLEYYWVRITTSVDMSATTAIQSVTNLFCHDTLMATYYPEILSDTRYLPSNRTDFMEQYQAAKDHVVRRMRQMGKITDEGDILDIVDVSVAAVHATAYIILNPIAKGSDELRAAANDAYKACEAELSRGTQAVDTNKDGMIVPAEKFSGTLFLSR